MLVTAPVDSVKLAARRYFVSPDWTWVRGRWYHEGADTVLGADLQRSQYAPRYYLNLSWWLRSADIDRYPRTYGHIVTRAESHAGEDESALEAMLDTETLVPDEERAMRLGAILERHLTPLMRLGETEAGLRSPDGARLLRRSLVTAPAWGLGDPWGDQSASPGPT